MHPYIDIFLHTSQKVVRQRLWGPGMVTKYPSHKTV
jgi:hypothetical protein